MTEQNYTPERVAQLNGWNTTTDRWRIWGTDEYREYITEKYSAERYREFGRMAEGRPEVIASVDEFLENLKQVAGQIPEHHRALAAYLRSREHEFGTFSGLAFDVLNGEHREAFLELTDETDFTSWGGSGCRRWTNAYRDILSRIPAPEVPGERVEPGGEIDWKAKYNALWDALRAEAEQRNWCEEFDEFSKEHGGPDREVAKTVRMEIYFDIKRPYREDTHEVVLKMDHFQRGDLVVDAILGELDPAAELFHRDEITTAIQNGLGFGAVTLDYTP